MKGRSFFLIFLLFVVLTTLVPYVWTGPFARFSASYLYWCLLTLVVILWAGYRTRHWGRRK